MPDSNISLEINRLSGQLPVAGLERLSNGSLSILHGNLFACNSIPQNDEYSRDYVCGSLNLNNSLFVFVSACGVAVVLVVVLAYWARSAGKQHYQHWLVAAVHSRCVLLWTYLTYPKHLEDTHGRNSDYAPLMLKIAKLSGMFKEVMRSAVHLLIVVLLGSLTLYCVKALDSSNAYATHSETYAWFWTLAYVRGVVPAGMLLTLWAGAISACFYGIVVHPELMSRKEGGRSESLLQNSAPARPATTAAAPTAEDVSYRHQVVPIGAAFVFNACVTVAVNMAYIYSTQQALGASVHFCIQLSLSIFRLVYVAVVFPLLSRPIRSVIENVRFRFMLLTINNLFLPCMVTALTSDACFQGLLIPADTVSTLYSYRTCVQYTTTQNMETYCSAYDISEVESASLVPPFTYNNQCGSVVLTSYIPVFLLGYSIQLLLLLIVLLVLTCVSYDSMPPSIRKLFHGIIWSEYWLQESADVLARDNIKALKMRTIFCNDVCNNWLLMVTFGLCSPVLAVAVVCSVLLKMSLWVLLVGRFTSCVLHKEEGDGGHSSDTTCDSDSTIGAGAGAGASAGAPAADITSAATTSNISLTSPSHPSETFFISSNKSADEKSNDDLACVALTALAKEYIPLFEVLATSFWRVMWCSAIFVALLSWDIAMDEVGWLQSVWVPLVPLCYGVLLRCAARLFLYTNDARYSSQGSAEKAAASYGGGSGVSMSPLHGDKL